MPTPNQMPTKANPLHQQLLAGLIETKPVSWEHKKLEDHSDDKNNNVLVTKHVRPGLRYPLAQNVSELNVNRAAKGFIK